MGKAVPVVDSAEGLESFEKGDNNYPYTHIDIYIYMSVCVYVCIYIQIYTPKLVPASILGFPALPPPLPRAIPQCELRGICVHHCAPQRPRRVRDSVYNYSINVKGT